MIDIYVINLDRSPARLDYMKVQGQRFNLEFNRFAAIDGSKLEKAAVDLFQGLTPGEIGCFLSHRGVWEAFLASDQPFALVLEDDARLSDAIPALLSDLEWVPTDADIVKLDTSGHRVGLDKASAPAPARRALHRLRTVHTGSAGYLVSRAGAGKLSALSEDFREAVDVFLFAGGDATAVYQMLPAAVAQAKRFDLDPEMASLIRAERRKKRPAIARRLLRELARPFRRSVKRGTQMMQSITLKRMFVRVEFK